MKKRLLAVLLACCMAAGMANAVFAADELPATAESAAAIAPADPDPPAPEPEIEAEPTPAPAPEPEIEAEPTPAADPAATPETARTLVMETLLAAPDTAAQTAVVTSAELVDSIRTDGCFTAKVNGSTDRLDGAVYTWYRSKDGTNWEEVPQQLCSGDAWNITPGSEHRLNAALDACIAGVRDAERLYYKVEVTGTDGAKLTAAAMQVPYCIQLQNGSFETPDIAGLKAYHDKNNNTPASRLYYSPDGETGSFFTQYPSGEGGIVWQTTGVARHWQTGSAGLYIELADGSNRSYNGTRNYPEASYSIDGAYDGQQFAELNCEAYGALYQDVLTVPGTTLHWSLAHRGRAGSDSMALLIAPVAVAQQITEILTQASADTTGGSVRSALDRTVDYHGQPVTIRSFMVGGEMTDGNTAWVTHRGNYTVAAGQYLSRFFFLALSCASGDRREGNLLDKVWFSTEPEPPVMGSGSLQLTKAVEQDAYRTEAAAVTNTFSIELPAGSYTLTYADGTAETRTLAAPGALRFGLRGLQSVTIGSLPAGRYTVTETDHPDLDSAYCTTTAAEAQTEVEVTTGATAQAVITNRYAPWRSLTITKQVTGGYGDTRRALAFTGAVDGGRVTADRAAVTAAGGAALTAAGFTIPHRGSVTIGHLKPGQTLTVSEEALADYETSFADGTAVTQGGQWTGTVGQSDTALTCRNNKDGVPPTGLRRDAAPALAAVAAALVCALLRRRRGV